MILDDYLSFQADNPDTLIFKFKAAAPSKKSVESMIEERQYTLRPGMLFYSFNFSH